MAIETVKILHAVAKDIPKLVELHRQSEEFHRENRPDIFRKPSNSSMEDMYGDFFKDPKTVILGARKAGALVGYLRFRIYDAPEISFLVNKGKCLGFIEDLAVAKGARRSGIGKLLIAEAESQMRGHGVQYIRLNVWKFNSHAETLYESMGYIPTYTQLSKDLH